MEGNQAEDIVEVLPGGDRYAAPATRSEKYRIILERIFDHLAFRVAIIILILIDFIVIIIDLTKNSLHLHPADIISMVISSIFVIELILRIYIKSILVVSYTNVVSYFRIVMILRVVRGLRILSIIRFYIEKRETVNSARLAVSQNKRRFVEDERLIAMSFPSTGVTALYRNDIEDVSKFFKQKHDGHFKIYNLCSEKGYDESKFDNRVERIFIDDHNVPKLAEAVKFVKDVDDWMKADEENVLAVHCRGGKGRTGTMVCIWLIASGEYDDAEEALNWFGERRTDRTVGSKFQGVETPSQSRYVGYYATMKKLFNSQLPNHKQLILDKIIIKNIYTFGQMDGTDLSGKIYTNNYIFEFNPSVESNCKSRLSEDRKDYCIEIGEDCPILEDDVKFMFFSSSEKVPKGYDDCAFYFWLNTSFVDETSVTTLNKDVLDNPHKDIKHKVFGSDFAVQICFKRRPKTEQSFIHSANKEPTAEDHIQITQEI
ncbi:DgyrCDS3903 [Dimorphilus gyrociliatus]|uniref:DgyrCDS3903 n=1 Tax=Dimorphilus gyrociliatus TaxID=2664684 RepID=A0A7I8VJX4_9ANNE|nr:DgyrCDS3903 [Dimorphilus gyrociliatus]